MSNRPHHSSIGPPKPGCRRRLRTLTPVHPASTVAARCAVAVTETFLVRACRPLGAGGMELVGLCAAPLSSLSLSRRRRRKSFADGVVVVVVEVHRNRSMTVRQCQML